MSPKMSDKMSDKMKRAIMERALREIAMGLDVRVPIHKDAIVTDSTSWRYLTNREIASAALVEIGYWTEEDVAREQQCASKETITGKMLMAIVRIENYLQGAKGSMTHGSFTEIPNGFIDMLLNSKDGA